MGSRHWQHNQPMQSPVEPHALDRWIDLGTSRSILLIIYKALVRSIINYGCIAYDSAATMTKDKLDRLKGQAMRVCCESLPGTVKASLQMQCSEPALSLRRRCPQSDYAVKIQSDRDHPTASIMKDCLQNIDATCSWTGSRSCQRTPSTSGNSTVYPAACGD